MDLTMVDVTDLPGVKVGDIVTVIGREGDNEITAEECAARADTIVYEITSGIGPRVARVFRTDGRIVKIRTLLEK
jgi:alanine racemase